MASISSRLFRVASAARGQWAPLDEFRTLLIDRTAESVESSLPVRGGTWCRTREHQSSVHSSDSSQDAFRGSLRGHALSTHLALHVEAVTPSWHIHRQLALLTHLEHPVEDHCDRCRSSFFVDSSRRLSYPHLLCVSSVSSRCTAGLLLTLSMCLSLLDLVELACSSWAWFVFFRHCCTQDLKSRSASFGVSLTLSFSRHTVFTELVVFLVR